ncbi:serum response factor-binding protein 1 [Bactrocera tryoni]|uniref:serum response factor-binding protein 1 n=1 Tax=Bactrocera tryoni TaxID=59916 RepID=UPI001A95E8D4|nr:serum response factor-binding protein 1 [Bactrocera tryoni]
MVNKLEFNNLVVTNKKKIQLIKSKTIQKLVQKIKKLKYLLDKNPEHDKNKERFRKAVLCLEEMKKLKCIVLMKRVLILEKSPSAILTNGLSSAEEMAVAMVGDNKLMQELAEDFKEKLGISKENKIWKKELMQASKKQIKIIKTEKKRKSRKALKEQKAMARKRTEWLNNQNRGQDILNLNEQKNEVVIKENDEGANVSTLGYWKIEEIDNKHPPIKNKKAIVKEHKEVSEKQQTTKNCKTSLTTNVNPSKNENQHWPKSEEIKKSSIEGNSNESSVSLNSPSYYNLSGSNAMEKNKEEIVTHVIDPFFITDSGENYRSSAVVVRNGTVFDPQISKKPLENTEKWSRETYENHLKSYDHFRPNNARQRISEKSIRKTCEEYKTEGLHPSWAAKQKLKSVISAFQGKKIRFEDNDDQVDEGVTNSNSKVVNIESQNKKHLSANRRKNKHTEEAVHPSWAAKQKFSTAITVFKGKKFRFGDDGVLQPSSDHINAPSQHDSLNTLKGLHPSWLAKQKQKSRIISFQGKKTTFQDDE